MFLADCSGVSGSPGVYSIQVDPDNSVQAACLEGGWTVIQSRGQFGNPTNYFAKGWAEYKAGFGMPGTYFANIFFCSLEELRKR